MKINELKNKQSFNGVYVKPNLTKGYIKIEEKSFHKCPLAKRFIKSAKEKVELKISSTEAGIINKNGDSFIRNGAIKDLYVTLTNKQAKIFKSFEKKGEQMGQNLNKLNFISNILKSKFLIRDLNLKYEVIR